MLSRAHVCDFKSCDRSRFNLVLIAFQCVGNIFLDCEINYQKKKNASIKEERFNTNNNGSTITVSKYDFQNMSSSAGSNNNNVFAPDLIALFCLIVPVYKLQSC